MKKITLYVDDKINNYHDIFSKECFDLFKNMSKETKIKLTLEGIKISSDKIIKNNNYDNDKEFWLYNAYVNMAVVAENLLDVKVENIK